MRDEVVERSTHKSSDTGGRWAEDPVLLFDSQRNVEFF